MIDIYNKSIILFPQKTGSTSFSRYLKTRQDHSYISYNVPTSLLRGTRGAQRHKNIHIYEQSSLNLEGWKIYQTARHPVTRFVSGFAHHCRIHSIDESRELAIRYLDNIPILQATNDVQLFTKSTGIDKLKYLSMQNQSRSKGVIKTIDEYRVFASNQAKTLKERLKSQGFPLDYVYNVYNTLFTPQNTWADVQKYDVTYLKLEEDNTQIYEEMGLVNFRLPLMNTFTKPDTGSPWVTSAKRAKRAKGTSVESYKNLLEDRDLVKRIEETYSKDLEILGYDSLL